MASAPCSCTTTFNRCAPVPGAKLGSPRSTHLRPSQAPTTWASWATTAGDRALGMALVSTRRRATPSACNVRPRHAVDDDGGSGAAAAGGGVTLVEVIAVDDDSRKVALGQVIWNSRDAPSHEYNRILKRQVTDENGDVEVQYAVLPNAVVVEVEVVLVDSGSNSCSADVYGSITATTALASDEQLHYTLFDKARDQAVEVQDKTAIPLQREIMSAQLGSAFEVSANLRNDPKHYTETDYQIINGTLSFTPRTTGTDSQGIFGPGGTVRVEVTWSTQCE